MKRTIGILLLSLPLWLMMACEEIDCSLYNTVSLSAGFYSDGYKVSITDTLTITTGTDEHILVNRMLGASEWEIPMSYWQDEDTLSLHVTGEGYSLTDTVWIQKTNMPHFESPDCPTHMFHEITAVRSTHHFIDSVTIVQAYVNYAQTENIQLHLFAAP